MQRWARCAAIAAVLATTASWAQVTPYDERMGDNISVLRHYLSYLQGWMSKPNHAPWANGGYAPADVFRAAAELEFGFEDQIQSEYEARYRDAYQQVVDDLQSYYPDMRKRFEEFVGEHNAERQGLDEYRQARLADAYEMALFALPFAVFEGRTPYNDLYDEWEAIYRDLGGDQDDTIRRLRRPKVSPSDLGTLDVISPQEARRQREASANAAKERIAEQARREGEAAMAATQQEVAEAQRQARAEAQRELAAAERMIADAQEQGQSESGGGFWIVSLLLLAAAGGAWFFRDRLSPQAREKLEQAGLTVRQGAQAVHQKAQTLKQQRKTD